MSQLRTITEIRINYFYVYLLLKLVLPILGANKEIHIYQLKVKPFSLYIKCLLGWEYVLLNLSSESICIY